MGNVARDRKYIRTLRKEWSVLTVWECETKDAARLVAKLRAFLDR
jgi:G:T-mismatch repair DNA endonuclease (very short patch repair protein)